MGSDKAPAVALRVAKDGIAQRVRLMPDDGGQGSFAVALREQIGCQMFEVIALDDDLDVWADEEALVHIDVDDRAQLQAEVNPVASMIVGQFGQLRQPMFGVALFTGRAQSRIAGIAADRLAWLERQVALFAGTDEARC